MRLPRFGDWPLRARLAALLVLASLLPLTVMGLVDVRDARQSALASATSLLAARGDELARELDGFNVVHLRAAALLARLPVVVARVTNRAVADADVEPLIAAVVDDQPAVRAVALIDGRGQLLSRVTRPVRPSPSDGPLALDPALDRSVRAALGGAPVVSDMYVVQGPHGEEPTVAYLAPVRDGDRVVGVAMILVRGDAMWESLRAFNARAGSGSFAVLFDQSGVRIGHTYSREIVFHPGGTLSAAAIEEASRTKRFGAATAALLSDVRSFPEQFTRARADRPDPTWFRGLAPVNQQWNLGVGRRLQTTAWTVFYMVPEAAVLASTAAAARLRILFGLGIMLTALVLGWVCAASILDSIRTLSTAVGAMARGDLSVRVPHHRGDEIGQLSQGFNRMAGELEGQSRAVALAREELEGRVEQRTAELRATAERLRVEGDERARVAEGLRASEERTGAIIDAALDAVIMIDARGLVTLWSRQAEAIFGWREPDVVGHALADTIVPPRYRDAHRRGLERYVATGEQRVLNRRIEIGALRRDGTEIPIELSITPLAVDGARAFSAFVRDISERRRAEDALRESEERFRSLSEYLPHLVWTCRPDGWCDYLSRQWVEFTGISAEAQLGSGWIEQVHADDQSGVATAWQAAVSSGAPYEVEFRIRRRDGAYRWFKTRALPLRDRDGAITKWFGSNTDIEDHRRAQDRLRVQLERLNLLDQITRAIGERQDLTSVLQAVVRNLEDGLPIDFACVCLYSAGSNELQVVTAGVRSEAVAARLSMTAGSRVALDENGLSRCVRGELVYEPDVAVIAQPFPTRLAAAGLRSLVAAPLLIEGRVMGVLLAARRDATAFGSADCEFLRQLGEHVALAINQVQLHASLQDAYEDLRRSQQGMLQAERLRALGQMASGIAHDINNAMSPVMLYAEALAFEETNLSSRSREYLETMQRAIGDVAKTVARLGEFYRLREPQGELIGVSLNALVPQVIALTRARWSDMAQRNGVVIRVETDLAPDLPDIMGVESEIREALTNLVFNAVDAMPTGGVLTLRTTFDGRTPALARHTVPQITLEVGDSGVGMDEETRRRCLEPFFTTKGERGTGLGLAMVYGIVQRHRASIDIDSRPGAGTMVRIHFDLPVDTGPGDAAGPEELVRVQPRRILVIDDDPLLLRSLHDTLAADGHTVTLADGGQAGIDLFSAAVGAGRPFDLVMTDLGMPYVDGRKVADAIKAASASTPVLLLTGWGQRLIADGEIPSSVDRVLAKPPRLRDLRIALNDLTAVSRLSDSPPPRPEGG